MEFPEEAVTELKKSFPDNIISKCDQAGITYFLISAVIFPDGGMPTIADLLYRPTPGDGYDARLFFSKKIGSKQILNWNTETVIFGKKWFAYSWRIDERTTLVSTLFVILRALK